jgi:hypothetical protein
MNAYIPTQKFNLLFSGMEIHKQKVLMGLFSLFQQEKWRFFSTLFCNLNDTTFRFLSKA